MSVRSTSVRMSKPNAVHEASRLGSMYSAMVVTSNSPGAYNPKASMPMKCMDQIPPPNVRVPDARANWRTKDVSARRANDAICSATPEASTASNTDSATSQGSCCAHKKAWPGVPLIKNWSSMGCCVV